MQRWLMVASLPRMKTMRLCANHFGHNSWERTEKSTKRKVEKKKEAETKTTDGVGESFILCVLFDGHGG